MDKLIRIQNERHISLPEIYKRFYEQCSFSLPANLVGTDLWNNNRFDLNEGAVELLQEDGAGNFLERDHFVFMMHQGYIFWYFRANGETDPIVYGYHEGKMKPDNIGHFSNFIKDYIQ